MTGLVPALLPRALSRSVFGIPLVNGIQTPEWKYGT